ncbi:MAG: efflux RND transporter permease subunit [Polyangiales bacterium]
MGSAFEGFLVRLGALQVRRPWVILALCAALATAALGIASRLQLKTKFDQLLPDSQPSVVELRRVADKTTSGSRVFIVLENGDRETRRKMADEAVPKLRAIGGPWVSDAADGVHASREFLMPRAALFLSTEELQKLSDDVDARWDYEVGKATGAHLLGDEDDKDVPKIDAESLKKRFLGKGTGSEGLEDRYPDGYFEAKDGHALVIVVQSSSEGGDLERSRETLRRVREVMTGVASAHPRIKVGYAGDLVTGLFEYGAILDDLIHVGVLGVGLVLGIVLLYYMRLRALLAMGLTILVGLSWTFAVTQLAIGHLNVATGFLVSIVAGNGINCGIILMARYFEARRDGRSIGESVEVAHRETWIATLSAALAAAAAYGSLAFTDFRGFKHFALIGAAGLVLCWIATYLLAPAVLVLYERIHPYQPAAPSASWWQRLRDGGSRYDAPFTFLAPRFPRAIAALAGVLVIGGMALGVRYVRSDPMEYDMRKLQNDLGQASEIYRVSALARDILGANTESGMVLLVDRLDQVVPLKRALEARRDSVPVADRPFEAVHTLLDFVPQDQAQKIPIVEKLRARLERAHERQMITEEDWARIVAFVPKKALVPYSISDLPDELARPFMEKDGTRGRLVYVEPTAGKNDNDLHYLLAWADSFRATKLPSGEIVLGSGRAVIFADMLRAVIADIPKAIAASLALTMLAVLVTFRRGGAHLVLGALFVGVAWLAAFLALSRVRINFLDFVALPITFGIGADYAVNVMQRYDNNGNVVETLKKTGGAVVLCSLTTILGYVALLGSLNQAVRSLGLVAVAGEVCCLLAAVLVLPAALLWRARRSSAPAPQANAVVPSAD